MTLEYRPRATADVSVSYICLICSWNKEFMAAKIAKPILPKNLSGSPENKILIREQLH